MKHYLKPETVRALENAESALSCAFDHVSRDCYAFGPASMPRHVKQMRRRNVSVVFAAQLRIHNLIPKSQRKTNK